MMIVKRRRSNGSEPVNSTFYHILDEERMANGLSLCVSYISRVSQAAPATPVKRKRLGTSPDFESQTCSARL